VSGSAIDERPRSVGIGEIGLFDFGVTTSGTNCLLRCFSFSAAAVVVDNDVGPGARESICSCAADACAAAGYQSCESIQIHKYQATTPNTKY